MNGYEKELLSLDLLLNQNFLCYDGKGLVPEQINAYLSTNWEELRKLSIGDSAISAKARDRWYVPNPNRAGDFEKLCKKHCLNTLRNTKCRKIQIFRLEAVCGLQKAWQEHDYAVIINVTKKIPNDILEEDPKLLMWFDQAVTRMGDHEGHRL